MGSGAKRHEVKLLVVDDEKLVRMVMSAKLRQAGYDCTAVGDVETAVAALKAAPRQYSAIITDIMMGEMDGFVFRDIVRGITPKLPVFFLTALDPEEGSGFLKRIMEDSNSYYLPKAVGTDILMNRVRQVVASHRVEVFIQNKIDEDRKSQELASHIQRSMLPVRTIVTPRGFYTTYWRPVDVVSGDLFEAVPFGYGGYLYVLGDIQGHGTSAALAMTAVQSFLKNLSRKGDAPAIGPEAIANMLQRFFRANLADVSYMTALVCIHRPVDGYVRWISCGAPDLLVMDGAETLRPNPERKGGVPIGLFGDTVYAASDVVETPLTRSAVCIAYTDGIMDLSRDAAGEDALPAELARTVRSGLFENARRDGTVPAISAMYIKALAELGYDKYHDDVTILVFGAYDPPPGMYEAAVRLSSDGVDEASRRLAEWCRSQGWPEEGVSRVQLVFEEKLMNIYDHGFDDREKLREVVSVRLRRVLDTAVLTVWDAGTEEPSIAVVAGDSDTAFEMANRNMAGRGRGRLIVRELCDGIERRRYEPLNETTYHVPLFGKAAREERGE
ncbi:MAG: SpoIIE family protein phosphatase [Kiritimatiellae bacterium]|nr:SpoIIE family protein phosphatase [Kiritimatiellia bacterium]